MASAPTSPDVVVYPRPRFRDWALLGVGLAFVAMGVLIVPRDRDVGIVTITFFGMCTAVAAATITRKLRFHSQRPLTARIAGGVPIRPSRTKLALLGGGFFFLGVVLITFGHGYGSVFWGGSWLIAGVGGAVIIGLLSGGLPVGHLQFDPDGMTIGRRGWCFTVPWDRIVQLGTGEYQSNPVLYVWLDDVGAVVARPPESMPKVLAHLASCERWMGAPVAVMTSQYTLDLPLLVRALERYVADPGARAELVANQLLLPAPG
ncbi:MAG TPA: hypothetical protein VH062_33040 [Polyangiaceae bacterium]|jgi:hypothetical protein|nr:hypothetical protein [Polyangiaceae bacterium]